MFKQIFWLDVFIGQGIQSFYCFSYQWQREWGKPVIDRVGLIIEIFNAHAQTKEAKLQVTCNRTAF